MAECLGLDGVRRQMHDIAVRDGQHRLAAGLIYLFGQAECPRCADVFAIAEAYRAAEDPPRAGS